VNELDSVRALEALRAWVTHTPRFAGLEEGPDPYADGTQLDALMGLALRAQLSQPQDDPDVLTLQGVIHSASSDLDCALDCFLRALEASPPGPGHFSLLNKVLTRPYSPV